MLRVISQLYLCAKAFSKSIEEADPGQGRPRGVSISQQIWVCVTQ
jgi:hypothetical protein